MEATPSEPIASSPVSNAITPRLARQLDGAKARADAEQADESKRAGANLRSDATKVADRGASYLLRRLARKAPDILARYEAGELPPKEHLLRTQKMEFPPILRETHEAVETFH